MTIFPVNNYFKFPESVYSGKIVILNFQKVFTGLKSPLFFSDKNKYEKKHFMIILIQVFTFISILFTAIITKTIINKLFWYASYKLYTFETLFFIFNLSRNLYFQDL